MTVSERLVAIREAYGYTRKRLADELGRSYRTITNYETGEREPGHAYIIEIAKKFGITTDYILGLVDIPTKVTSSLDVTIGESERIKKYRTLDEYGKEVVDSVLTVEYRRCEEQYRAPTKLSAAARTGIDLSEEDLSQITLPENGDDVPL